MTQRPFHGLNGCMWWQGVVECVDDPLQLGRVQVRLFGLHSVEKVPNDETGHGIPTEDLPWASPSSDITSAGTSGIGTSPVGLVEGSHVWGIARDGRDYSDLVVIGSFVGIPKTQSQGRGFEDPNKIYPKRINESDVSRLSRGDITETWVKAQQDSITKNELFSEPKSPYAAKYPFNRVMVSRSGHVSEIDDTKGAERLSWFHKSGTFREIHPEGTQNERIVKDRYQIVLGNDSIHVSGNVKIYVDGNVEQVVKGNVTQTIHQNVTQTVKGNVTEKVDGNINQTVGGNLTQKVGGNWSVEASAINFKAGGTTIDSAVNTTSTIKSDGDQIAGNISTQKHKHIGNLGKPTSPSQP